VLLPRSCWLTCNLAATQAICPASQPEILSFLFPATALWQPRNLRLTCKLASLTDLHAAAARALFKPGEASHHAHEAAAPSP
jgi:hypothetical protein